MTVTTGPKAHNDLSAPPALADETLKTVSRAPAVNQPPAGEANPLTYWSTIAAVCAATAFVLERARMDGYSRYYRVPSEFVNIDPRLAYIPVLQRYGLLAVAASIGIVWLVRWVRARAAQRKESQLFRPAGTRGAVFRGRSLLWLYLLFAVIVLLVTANYVGGYLGREQAAERTVYFVAGPVVAERTVVVLFMRQDTLLVADVTRSSAEASWQMKSGFRFLPVDEAENVKRVRLGTIAQAPLIVAPSP